MCSNARRTHICIDTRQSTCCSMQYPAFVRRAQLLFFQLQHSFKSHFPYFFITQLEYKPNTTSSFFFYTNVCRKRTQTFILCCSMHSIASNFCALHNLSAEHGPRIIFAPSSYGKANQTMVTCKSCPTIYDIVNNQLSQLAPMFAVNGLKHLPMRSVIALLFPCTSRRIR